jgi:hypothetical protein
MEDFTATHETISFGSIQDLPDIDLVFTACRIAPGGYLVDIVDFSERTIDRWSLPLLKVPRALAELKNTVPGARVPFAVSHETFFDDCLMGLHTAQLSGKKLLLCMGDFFNGFHVPVIDTETGSAAVFPEDFAEPLMLYSSTGDFTPDREYWIFVRWPFRESLDILAGARDRACCEIGRIRLSDLQSEILYRMEGIDRIHQVSCSPDGRYLVFSPFRWEMNQPYPDASMANDPDGYRRSHQGGMKKDELITVDLEARSHWRTEIPVPVPAHFEFDPGDPSVFYLSAHHFHPIRGNVILEGSASLFKMRIRDGETLIEGQYSDDQFFRMSQHIPFLYGERLLIAVTNLPNKLDLVDAESMALWRRVELFPAPPVDRSATGNVICPVYPESCFAVNPSRDGRFIVLEASGGFLVYSLEEDSLLPARIPRFLPEGVKATGHTRREQSDARQGLVTGR